MRELTFRAVLLGIILGVILGSANAYLGLKAGMTVAAAIPAAVISMLILTKLLKNGTILENNMVQTMASVAQAVAAGVIFTVPTFFILHYTGVISFMPSYWLILTLTFIGSLWGVVFMIIFRKPHIVDEHDSLPYPEGTACAEVLKTGQKATENAKFLLRGFITAAILKVFQSIKIKIGDKVYKIFEEIFTFSANFKNLPVALQKITLSIELLPALFGVGMIVGVKIGIMIATGALLAWWVIIPIIGIFQPEMSAYQIYKGYVRYIGIGVIVTGAIFSFFQFSPLILNVIKGKSTAVKYRKDPHQGLWYDNPNYTKDIPYPIALILVFIGSLVFFFINPVESLFGKFLSFLVLLIFAILFTAVSSYIVGMLGSSNQPVSAMTISTLIAVALALKFIGMYGEKGIIAVLVISVIACISLAIAGDMSQDLKTGFLVKATPYNQQIVGIISAIVSSFFLSYLIFVLNNVYGFVGNNPLPAPQANLIATLAQSIFQGDVKWNEIVIGMFLGLIARLLGFSILAFGVGVYLPLGLSIPILLGGWFSNLLKNNEERKVLVGSGLIAGDTIIGIVFVFLIAANIMPASSDKDIAIFGSVSPFVSLAVFILMIYVVYSIIRNSKGTREE